MNDSTNADRGDGPPNRGSEPNHERREERPAERRIRFYRALRDAGYEDLTIIAREDLVAEFNRRHLRIIDHLRDHEAESVRALARTLGFDKKDVSEDLNLLARLGVVEFERDGRRKVPSLATEHVVVEPLA